MHSKSSKVEELKGLNRLMENCIVLMGVIVIGFQDRSRTEGFGYQDLDLGAQADQKSKCIRELR